MKQTEKIDFVITWVDGSDKKWKEKFCKYKYNGGDTRDIRYRDTDTLKYWFRAVEKYASWVNKIYFITDDQIPEWLNLDNEKLVYISHKDYIPKEYLPTFSSHTIELNLHRIDSLSEQFVLFNDDVFINDYVSPEDFFVNGLPKDTAVMNPTISLENPPFLVPCVDNMVINRHFNKKEVLKKNFRKFYNFKYGIFTLTNIMYTASKYFVGFNTFHLANSFKKSTFYEVWNAEYDLLHNASLHKFRQQTDPNQWVFQYWQFCKGEFMPRNPKIGLFKIVNTQDDLDEVISCLKNSSHKIVTINDSDDMELDFDEFKNRLIREFEQKFPTKSSFEK